MKNEFKEKILIYSFIMGIILILFSGFIIFMEFKKQTSQCLASPLTYSAKWMEETYKTEFQGYGFLKSDKGVLYPVFFNTSNYAIENPK